MYFAKHKSARSLFHRHPILITTLLFALCADSQFIAPSPRKDSCSFTDQNTLYVLGGSAGTDTPPNPDFFIPKDSFYSLDLSVKVNATSAATTGWKAVTMQGATPVSGHTCVLLPNRVLLVFGSGKKSSNPFLQAFDLKTQLWMPPPPTTIQTELSGLYGHTSGLVGHYVVLTGGKRDLPADGWSTSWTRTLPVEQTIAQPNLDTYVLDVSVGPVWTWTRYRGITSVDGKTPSGRMFATSWVSSNGGDQLPTFYLTGGLSVAPVNTSNFDGRSIWKFDPVTGEWDKDSRRTLDVSAFGMAAAVVPGTSTVYFQGGQDPTNGTFVTSSRTLDFDAMSDGLPRIISGFAGTDTGRSRHVLNFIDNSTTLAVFGGVTSLNNAINELHFLSVDPPGVSSIFDPKAKVAVGPTPPPVSRPSQDPNPSQGDPIIVIILVFIIPLVAVLLLLLIVWVKRTADRRSRNSTQRRGANVRREKPHFDLEMGESAAKLLQNVQTNVGKPADTVGKSLPEVPRPPLFAPSALSTVREIIEPSHLYRSIGGDQRLGDKWSYPPLPRMSATNRSSTYTTSGQSNHTDDVESLLWLENRRVSSRRSHDSFGTDSSGQRSSPSFAESSSPFPSSMSNSESVSSRSSNMLDVPVSSRLRWTLSEVYIPKLPPGYAYGNANRTASTSASPECSDHDETASLLSERFSSVDDNIENGSQELRGLQRPQPAYSLPYQE